jgi:hypothetical protein
MKTLVIIIGVCSGLSAFIRFYHLGFRPEFIYYDRLFWLFFSTLVLSAIILKIGFNKETK